MNKRKIIIGMSVSFVLIVAGIFISDMLLWQKLITSGFLTILMTVALVAMLDENLS